MFFFFRKFWTACFLVGFFLICCPAGAQENVVVNSAEAQAPPAEAAPGATAAVGPQAPEASEDEMDFNNPFQSALPEEQMQIRQEIQQEEEARAQVEPEETFDASGLNVTGLVWGEAAPKAIINESIYGIGDEINEAKIVKISKEGIAVNFKGREYLMKRDSAEISEKGGA
jgi:hypothetical protein